jgi:hypothetical protein
MHALYFLAFSCMHLYVPCCLPSMLSSVMHLLPISVSSDKISRLVIAAWA